MTKVSLFSESTGLIDNLNLLKPYTQKLLDLNMNSIGSCLGCDYRVPLLENNLCMDCDTPGIALTTYRQYKEKLKNGNSYKS